MKIDCKITENYFKERNRMVQISDDGLCFIPCQDCLLYKKNNGKNLVCTQFEPKYPEIAIELIQKWSDEHQQMTNLDYLLKHFPNTKLDEDGTPSEVCPDSVGLPLADGIICKGNAVDCQKCWSRLYEEN